MTSVSKLFVQSLITDNKYIVVILSKLIKYNYLSSDELCINF